jgi:demethylmenaquinone methyltransferase/2-methoxy-6-polyprenyl-1,4-benzoquinol methylase
VHGRILAVPLPPEKENPHLMRAMFSTIAPRYDFITRAFSFGMDSRWKRLGLRTAKLSPGSRILDLACGTGDFARLVAGSVAGAYPIAADLTPDMLQRARERGVRRGVCADALHLPFRNATFDCVFVGYGLRNFPGLAAAVDEIRRVTKPGGGLISLDFFLPRSALLRKIYLGYLYLQGAFWGALLHGRPRVYMYIPDSLRGFVSIDELSALLLRTGYRSVTARAFIFGGIGLHGALNADAAARLREEPCRPRQ